MFDDDKVTRQEETLYLPGLVGSKVARGLSGSLNGDAFGILSDNNQSFRVLRSKVGIAKIQN